MDLFKFQCNKVLPLVYEESLSYYEAICKIYEKLNEIITVLPGYEDQSSAIEELQTFATWATEKIEEIQTALSSDDVLLSGLRTDVNANETAIETCNTNITSNTTAINALSVLISTLQSATAELRTDVDANATQISSLETALETLQSSVMANTTSILGLGTWRTTATGQISTLESKTTTLEVNEAIDRNDIANLKTWQTVTNPKVTTLESTVATHTSEIDDILGGEPTLAGYVKIGVGNIITIYNDILATGIQKFVDERATDTTINTVISRIMPSAVVADYQITIRTLEEQIEIFADLSDNVWTIVSVTINRL